MMMMMMNDFQASMNILYLTTTSLICWHK